MAVQISGNDITVPRDGTFSRNVSIAGTLTYEDVTNVDSIGLVTARNGIEVGASPGVAASISVDGNMIVSGISTFGGDVQVPDKIIHAGDTNTAIRFPAADALTIETGGSETFRITGAGATISTNNSNDSELTVEGTGGATVHLKDSGSGEHFRLSANGQASLYAVSSHPMVFYTGGVASSNERLRIGTSGQIGIAGANYGTDGQVLTSKGSSAAVQWATPSAGLYSGYALMEEAIEHGATAHTKTAGNWYTKQLTRISFDPQSIIVSLSSNDFTLAAGTYVIKWVHFLERCDSGLTRLYDVTNSTSKKVSMCGFAQDSGNYAGINSRGIHRLTISGNTTYRYQYFVESANSILYGPADSDNTEEEIFGQVEVWKEY